jgi:hypothetical protein
MTGVTKSRVKARNNEWVLYSFFSLSLSLPFYVYVPISLDIENVS